MNKEYTWKKINQGILQKHRSEYDKNMKIKILILCIIFFDIGSKWLTNILGPEYVFLGGIGHITKIKNTGIAFGTPLPGIHIIIPLILLGIWFFMIRSWKQFSEYEKIGFVCLFTGWLMNALERAIFGSVTDMVSIQHFAVFNVADIAVTLWAFILIASSFLSRKKT